jgi:HK97 gp10 family phage protein
MMAVSIAGLPELNAAFKAMGDQVSKKTGLRMVAAAAGVVRNQAKNIARSKGLKKTGTLINNIAIKREKNVPSNVVQYHVGVRHGREFGRRKNVVKYLALGKRGRIVTKYKNDPYYWRFLEFGTKHIRPLKFLEPALESKRQEAVNAMQATLQKELLKVKA